ncbi:MAG: T9SS type A sorting domain-containing protein [Chitinophagales bacterium]|nr:T9SS type A sorting domain-containing protein [Chitinophagales bacterium]MDW8418418.1 T9SS type A sorting domain-containing protein [Chitinophagales bacterium]
MMKILPFFVCSFLPIGSAAQISLTADDFPDTWDTVRMSVAAWSPQIDYQSTGPNYTWDFSNLNWQTQYVDTFRSPLFTNPVYAFTFSNLPLNPYQSNLAVKQQNINTGLPIISSVFSDPYAFYLKNNAALQQKGLGLRISGIPTSVPFSKPDTIYRFPIVYGIKDTSLSQYNVTVPQLGDYTYRQRRVNEVDGWGTLTTPFGTYEVLRIKTEIRGVDSLYIDSLGFGFNSPADITREYKWIGDQHDAPLLQINTQITQIGNIQLFEVVTRILYRDYPRFSSVANLSASSAPVRVYPNPAHHTANLRTSQLPSGSHLSFYDLHGRLVHELPLTGNALYTLDLSDWAPGIYLGSLFTQDKPDEYYTFKLVVF